MNKEQNVFPIGSASYSKMSVFGMRFVGLASNFKSFIDTLVRDFNEPKFGYNGELWDEEEKKKYE